MNYPVQYPDIDFKYLLGLYHKEGNNILLDIEILLEGTDKTIAKQASSGKSLAEITLKLDCSKQNASQSLADATYELYRFYQFDSYKKQGKNSEDILIELLSIARIRKYGGIGKCAYESLKEADINTAEQLAKYGEKRLLKLSWIQDVVVEKIRMALNEVNLRLER